MFFYGKPSKELFSHKSVFFSHNKEKLEEMSRLAELYIKQPRRLRCKNCNYMLGKADFTKRGVDYALCTECGHLNGCHEDTEEFCQALYTADDGVSYGATYHESDRLAWSRRVDDIYLPKAEFLANALQSLDRQVHAMSFADFGAGSGFFVKALQSLGISSVKGYEVSRAQVRVGQAMLQDKDALQEHDLNDSVKIASETQADVVSMVGVLEHLREPREVLAALRNNENVEFIYFSVPLFSPCVFIEMDHPNVFPRHLAGAHTHLYTESSIRYFCKEFSLGPVAEWWFGSDVVDLYRNMLVNITSSSNAEKGSARAGKLFTEMFKPVIDDMQKVLDIQRLSSEVHMLVQRHG